MSCHPLGSRRQGGRPSTAVKSAPSTRYCLVMSNISTISIVPAELFLQRLARVLTTVMCAAQLGSNAEGLGPWTTTTLTKPGQYVASPRHLLATDLQASNRCLEKSRVS